MGPNLDPRLVSPEFIWLALPVTSNDFLPLPSRVNDMTDVTMSRAHGPTTRRYRDEDPGLLTPGDMFRRPLLALTYTVLALELSADEAVAWLDLLIVDRHGRFSVTRGMPLNRSEPIRIRRLA